MNQEEEATPDLAPDADLVVQLLREQAPGLSGEPVRALQVSGSSNWVFRLGDDRAVRLPRPDGYEQDLLKEVRWLPRLGSALTVPVPHVELVGRASRLFPRSWAVMSWVSGDLPDGLDGTQQAELAETLGQFLQSLHAIDASGITGGVERWGYRSGEPVTDTIDLWAGEAADRLSDLFDPESVRTAWRRLRDVPPATAPPCWVHTDLSAENLLVRPDGRLSGVIDFGGLGIGDRSVDLLYGWSLFDAPARDVLRSASGADDATWSRARAWAFVGPGLLTIAHYRETLPERTRQLIVMVENIAAEVGVDLR